MATRGDDFGIESRKSNEKPDSWRKVLENSYAAQSAQPVVQAPKTGEAVRFHHREHR
ncbi:hypothetical protein PLANPX_5045 [Lacipirellula parvula]|uniref:Uncharacterized protein n=1 Tax=Lacipirellula parvula TaxID=2650471 RepID=A0A5K7XLP8_9BACT|nr:hypothetical protein PLANPX_5045 [Lacipirellula parvula]